MFRLLLPNQILSNMTAGFINEGWGMGKSKGFVAGNVAQFDRNAKLQRKLFAKGGRTLVDITSRNSATGIEYTAKCPVPH